MILHVLPLVLLAAAPPAALPSTTSVLLLQDRKAEYAAMRAEAEGDAEKLWKVYDWCEAFGMSKEGRSCLRAIIKLDDSKKAHELLGEIYYDSKWFPNEKKLEAYKEKRLKEEAKRTGKVIYEGQLVDPADLPYLEQGMVRGHDGRWISAEDHKRLQEGWLRQDLEWIPPEEAANMDNGLWKCDGQWLSETEADTYHAEMGRWWKIPGDHFLLYTTLPRATAEKALAESERTYADLNRIFGRAPADRVLLVVLNSIEQYNRFAGGESDEEGRPVELRGFSSFHAAFIAEVWSEALALGKTGPGVAFWDPSSAAGNSFGPTYVRHAAGHSIVEALDPSPKTLGKLVGPDGEGALSDGAGIARLGEEYWEEKLVPMWFRYGAASYAERYFIDGTVTGADGNPFWAREWSVGNLLRAGGLDSLEEIFAFALSLDEIGKASKLFNEAGLLVAFIVDGECPPVVKAHSTFKEALGKGKGVPQAMKALETAIEKNEEALRTFAGL